MPLASTGMMENKRKNSQKLKARPGGRKRRETTKEYFSQGF